MMADNTGDGIHSTGNRNSRPYIMINVSVELNRKRLLRVENQEPRIHASYEGWNFNSGNYLFTTDTK